MSITILSINVVLAELLGVFIYFTIHSIAMKKTFNDHNFSWLSFFFSQKTFCFSFQLLAFQESTLITLPSSSLLSSKDWCGGRNGKLSLLLRLLWTMIYELSIRSHLLYKYLYFNNFHHKTVSIRERKSKEEEKIEKVFRTFFHF